MITVPTTFASLEQRMIWAFHVTAPDEPVCMDLSLDLDAQKHFYAFLSGIRDVMAANPGAFVGNAMPDDAYDDWVLKNSKPKLSTKMNAIRKKIEDFYKQLIAIGLKGEWLAGKVKVNKLDVRLQASILAKLETTGLRTQETDDGVLIWHSTYDDIWPVWQALARAASQAPRQEAVVFSHFFINSQPANAKAMFDKLLGGQAGYDKLVAYLSSHDYPMSGLRQSNIVVDWAKLYGDKPEPLKDHWAERNHGGLSIWFDFMRFHPVFFGLRLPRHREIMANFERMDPALQEFALSKVKRCDNCGYCTQTDKTGTRPKQSMVIEHNGLHEICPLFPGFYHQWVSMDAETADKIIAYLVFIDQLFST